MSVHFERVGDELLMAVQDEDDTEGHSRLVASFPIPCGVEELLRAIEEEAFPVRRGRPTGARQRCPICGRTHQADEHPHRPEEDSP